jgi:replicative DNA helicase
LAHDNEIRLISKAVRDRNIIPLIEARVTTDWWVNPDARDLWRWLIDHWGRYGEVPTPTSVLDEFPNFPLLKVEDSLEYLLDRFVSYRRYVHVEDMLQGAAEILSRTNDHEAAINIVERSLSEIHQEGVPGVSDLHLHRDPLRRFDEYIEAEKIAGSLLGLTTGFVKIDEATAGLQAGQLVTVIAPPKTGKSQVLLQMGINMHTAGHNVLFQTFEMTNAECRDRHDAMRSKVSYNRMRRRALLEPEKNSYRDMLESMAEMENNLTLSDSLTGITVSALAAKIEQHHPDVVMIDGVYLMMDEASGESNTPQALTSITRSLKRLAQRLNIPIVISTQTLLWKMRGGKVTADSIGYSSSFFQDSDVILGLEEIDQEPEARLLKVVASRNCGPEEAVLIWRWDTGCFHDDDLTENCAGCAVASRSGPYAPKSSNIDTQSEPHFEGGEEIPA